MSYNYATYLSTLQSLLVANDPNGQALLNNMMPNIIDYGEQRIYRELDLISTVTSTTSTTVAGSRNVMLQPGLIVLNSANFITPANTAPDVGTRNPMRRVTEEFLNYSWPLGTTTSGLTPSIAGYYAVRNNGTLLIAPAPDSTYAIEQIGTYRPAPLSATNTTTFLTTYLPDLFLAASMVFASGYQRDFGAQSDDPQMAQSWENQYKILFESANAEELRKKAQSASDEPFTYYPQTQQQRT